MLQILLQGNLSSLNPEFVQIFKDIFVENGVVTVANILGMLPQLEDQNTYKRIVFSLAQGKPLASSEVEMFAHFRGK